MARLIVEFTKSQPTSTDAGFNGLVSELEALVAHADEVAQTQQAGQSMQTAATRRRNELRRRKLRDQVRYLVHVAQRAAIDNPSAVGSYDMPRDGGPLVEFVTAAKRLLAEAKTQQEALASKGLTTTALADLQASLDELDDETVKQHDGMLDNITARIELEEIALDCVRISRALDGIFRQQFEGNPQLLGAWNSVRRVVTRAPRHRQSDPGPVVPPLPSSEPPASSTQAQA
ncbi:MAG: hypothetical protein ACREL5_12030 [Gemmatimonadales bacterium]